MALTSTYDHRVIQGALSGEFLGLVHTKLLGQDGFYDRVFRSLRVPVRARAVDPGRRDVGGGGGDQARAHRGPHPRLPLARAPHGGRRSALVPAAQAPRPRHPDPRAHHLGPGSRVRDGRLRGARPPDACARCWHGSATRIAAPWASSTCTSRTARSARGCRTASRAATASRRATSTCGSCAASTRARPSRPSSRPSTSGQKRFSLEGGESLIPLLDAVLTEAATAELDEVCIGMAHRGRLNVLANLAGKSYAQIFSEFEGAPVEGTGGGSGDVKYHLGTDGVFTTESGETVNVYLAANPSHLEAVNPVLEGIVRAKIDRLGADVERGREARAAHPHPRRRRVRRPGRRPGDAQPRRPARVPHGRHHPRDRQQPGGLHDRPARRPAPRGTARTSPRASRSPSST